MGHGGDTRTHARIHRLWFTRMLPFVLWLPVLLLLIACGSDGLMHHGVRCVQNGWTALWLVSEKGHTEGVGQLLMTHKQVAVLEEHVPHGGLGSRVKEIAWDTKANCRLDTFSLKDEFIHCYGTHEELLSAHGLNVEEIVRKLKVSK